MSDSQILSTHEKLKVLMSDDKIRRLIEGIMRDAHRILKHRGGYQKSHECYYGKINLPSAFIKKKKASFEWPHRARAFVYVKGKPKKSLVFIWRLGWVEFLDAAQVFALPQIRRELKELAASVEEKVDHRRKQVKQKKEEQVRDYREYVQSLSNLL